MDFGVLFLKSQEKKNFTWLFVNQKWYDDKV